MSQGNGKVVIYTDVDEKAIDCAVDWVQGASRTTVDGRLWTRSVLSREARCNVCDIDFPPPVARLFNFNNPLGACPACEGFGDVVDIDMNLVVPDTKQDAAPRCDRALELSFLQA
jgi:excinuclease ABC subunit A